MTSTVAAIGSCRRCGAAIEPVLWLFFDYFGPVTVLHCITGDSVAS